MPPVAPAIQIACVALALLLGFVGFTLAYDAAGIPTSLAKRGAESARLIVGHFPQALEDRDLPLVLWIARYALPLLTTWTTVALAWRQLRNPFRLWRIRTQGDHLVIAGDEGLARRVVEAELARGRRVLLWVADATARWVTDLVERGAATIEHVAADPPPDTLALGKARALLLLSGDDAANAALAASLRDAAHGRREPGDPLDIIVRVDDLDLRRGVERRFERAGAQAARVRFASLPDLAARQLFVEAPLDGFRRDGLAERTVFLLGLSPAVERYVLRLLAGSHFRDGVRPRFVVVERDPPAQAANFAARNPGADALSPLVFEAGALDRPAAAGELVRGLVARHGEPCAIVIDAGDDARTIALGLGAADHYAQRGIAAPPIYVRLAAASDALLGATLGAFGTLEQFADPELLLQEDHDALARSIHDFYLQGRFDEGEKIGARASMNEWEDLPESFRDDNRLVADCYALKLRDIGARVVAGDGPPMRIEPAELEELSRAEHDRWMGAKLKDGWRFGEPRDDAARLHPDIVPYDALSERIKDLDREQVRAITRLLSVSGRRALRTLTIAVDPRIETRADVAVDALVAAMATHYPDRVALVAGDVASAARAVLVAADARDLPVLVALSGNAEALLAPLDPAARAQAVLLLKRADSIVAVAEDAHAGAWLAAHADLRLTSDLAACGPRDICIDAAGTIVEAPWTR